MIAEKNQHSTAHGEIAAKVIGSVIIAGIVLMFGYSLLHWIIFE